MSYFNRLLGLADKDLNRLQDNIAEAFAQVAVQDDHNLVLVQTSRDYKVTGQEDIIGVLSGSVTITLLPPAQQKRKLTVTAQGGQATVKTGDNSFSDQVSTGSKTYVSTGKAYWKLT